jgi:hypothetical protein
LFRSLNQARTQCVALHIPTDDEEMIIVLYRKTLVSLLVNMAQSAGVIMSMIAHGVGAAHPAHEPTHLAVHKRTQDEVIVIGHQLVRKQLYLMDLKRFVKDSLERIEVGVFVENGGAQVPSIQGMVQSACFVSPWWSRHPRWSPVQKASAYHNAISNQRGLTPLIFSQGLRSYFDFYSRERKHSSLDRQTPAEVYRSGRSKRVALSI